MTRQVTKPSRVIHCDWGGNENKRWMAIATRKGDRYLASASALVGDNSTFLRRLRYGLKREARVLIGFDFPVGLPAKYAKKAGVKDFISILEMFGLGDWDHFYDKCEKPQEINLKRPFFPKSCPTKGAATRQHLTDRLGLEWDELYRECEKATDERTSACPIFWTLGGNQVGTAAISGWRDVIVPALRCETESVGIWPFHGNLQELLNSRETVFAETYPGETYSHLGFPSKWTGKRNQAKRRERSDDLLRWTKKRNVRCDKKLVSEIEDGFGAASDGEDRFDAVVGLFGMLEVVLGHRSEGVPDTDTVRRVEGWIFGQQVTSPKIQHNRTPK